MKLLSNVFTLDAYSLLHKSIWKDDALSGKWKNLIKTYPMFVKRFHLPDDLLPKPKTCVTIGGMYFLYLLETLGESPKSLGKFLGKFQGITQPENLIIYKHQDNIAIFSKVELLSGELPDLTHLKPFNDAIFNLIAEYTIVPKMAAEGLIFDVTTEKLGELCTSETSLKRYLHTTK